MNANGVLSKNEVDLDEVKQYGYVNEEGIYKLKLIFREWGKTLSLCCFFENEDGEKDRLKIMAFNMTLMNVI